MFSDHEPPTSFDENQKPRGKFCSLPIFFSSLALRPLAATTANSEVG